MLMLLCIVVVGALVAPSHSKPPYVGATQKVVYTQPEQVHLSYGKSASEMVVTWVTQSPASSKVEYGASRLSMMTNGVSETFQDGGTEKRTFVIHRATMTGLIPGRRYFYHCGSEEGWSDLYYFTAVKDGSNWSPRFAVYGDMGNVNAKSLGRLQEETQNGHFDAILHVGDFAYNFDTDNARVGDAFMNQIQSVASYVPYMTCVGNHEQMYNFSNYRRRFSMPGGDMEGSFYSFNVGPVHIVGFSSEFYYFTQYGSDQIAHQYKWLQQDLMEANMPENRAQRPWIITMCHRPLYCSNHKETEHCENIDNLIRVGIGKNHEYGIEKLLYKYGVDLHFQAHEHSYERMFPVYNMTVCNGSSSEPYKNPRATVHMVTGSAGCQEGVQSFDPIPHPWSASHSSDYGYTRMTIQNSTHLYMEQVSDDKGGAVIDKVTIIKEKHGLGLFDCHKTPRRSQWPPATMRHL